MERRRLLQMLAALAALLMIFALAQGVAAEPETDEHGNPVVVAPSTEPTLPEDDTDETTTTEPPTTFEWEGLTDENGVTLYPPRPSVQPSTKPPPTTVPKTTTTQKPTTTAYVPLGYIPNFYYTPPTEPGETYATIVVTKTVQTEPPSTEEEDFTDPEPDNSNTDFFEEHQPPPMRWNIIIPAGVLLLVALCGVIIMLRRGNRVAEEEEKAFEGGLWGPEAAPEKAEKEFLPKEEFEPIEFPADLPEKLPPRPPKELPKEAPKEPPEDLPKEPPPKKNGTEITKQDIEPPKTAEEDE